MSDVTIARSKSGSGYQIYIGDEKLGAPILDWYRTSNILLWINESIKEGSITIGPGEK